MSSSNISGRSSGCSSIPVSNSPLRTFRHNYPHSDFCDSPIINSRFQPRQTSPTTHDPLINHSQYNHRPLYQQPTSVYSNHSNEDILLSPINLNNKCRSDSDFIQPNSFRRSSNIFHDFPDSRSTYVNQFNNPHDRSRSPASQRGESPTRPPPTSSASQQQQQESDFKIPKDATSASSVQSNDQQVPSTDILTRDPNTIALEKLEQIKQNLADLNQQVEIFHGSTRDDRIYKLLDEQALKIMLRCDELLNVSVDIKEKRKEMIQNVQTILAKLESKVPIPSNSNQMENTLIIYDPSINNIEPKTEDLSIEQST